ncbi:MAG: NADPH-dependent F420 reductase [Actinomycetes bacterium]
MRIGLIGSGRIGGTLARLAVDNGYEVVLSNSRGPESLADLAAELGEHASAGTVAEAAVSGEVVVVTVPLKVYATVPADLLYGKVVIDTNNYYPDRDAHFTELDDGSTTSSELLAEHLSGSFVVKAFNTIYFEDLATQGQPAGTPGRRALPIAGDDASAKAIVIGVIDSFGFDVVDAGPLSEGWRFQPGMPAYNVRMDASELRAALADARR